MQIWALNPVFHNEQTTLGHSSLCPFCGRSSQVLKFFIYVYIRDSIDQSKFPFFELGRVEAAEPDHRAPRPPPRKHHFLYVTCKRLIHNCEIQSINSNAPRGLSSLQRSTSKNVTTLSERRFAITTNERRIQVRRQTPGVPLPKITHWTKLVADFSLRVGMLIRENPWPGLWPPQITLGCLHEVGSHRGQAKDSMLSRSGRQIRRRQL